MMITRVPEEISPAGGYAHCECWFVRQVKKLMVTAPVPIQKTLYGFRLTPGVPQRKFPKIAFRFDGEPIQPSEYVDRNGCSFEAQKAALELLGAHPLAPYFLIGPSGVGKSFLLWAMAKEAAYSGARVIFRMATDYIEAVKDDQFLSRESDRLPNIIYPESDFVVGRYGPTHLYLDEIDNIPQTEFSLRKMFDLISYCHDHSDKVVVSLASNQTVDQLIKWMGKATVRRIGMIAEELTFGA